MRKITFAAGEYYHVYNRGVDKRKIFISTREYERFLSYLYVLNTEDQIRPADLLTGRALKDILQSPRGEPLVALGAYCLMPNHFHLYLTPLVENGISKFMQRLQTAYTMYFNEKHQRSGALFQGTFKAQHVVKDQHAKYLFSYIHLNPAKLKEPRWKEVGIKDLKRVKAYVCSYPYSSYNEYLSQSHRITNPSKFPNYLSNADDFATHIEWLNFREV